LTSHEPARPNTETAPIEAVLFDMGGVLVRLGSLDELLGTGMSAEEFWPRWLASSAVRGLEGGTSSLEAFGHQLRDDLELDLEPDEIVERFLAFPCGLYPGAVELVASVPDTVTTGVLSNTNEAHWEHQIDAATVQGLCQHQFLSYRLGLLKPDREIYEAVLGILDRPADRVLFIDDNQINVDGARAVGLRAEVAKGPAAAGAVLAAYGVGG
jgi:putative hydrolase of the HAD superfamily